MGKLINCQTCGQQIAAEAKTCPHCGGKNKKRKSGCLPVFIALVIFSFVVIPWMASRDVKAPEGYKTVGKEDWSQNISMGSGNTGGRQTGKPYDENTCVFLAKKYAEKRLDVKTKLEWVGNASVEKLPRKNFYAVEHDFTVLNAYNVEIKHRARISMEFNPDRGYRGVWLSVDGKTI